MWIDLHVKHNETYSFLTCTEEYSNTKFNPLNTELNPICHLLALLGAHHIFHVSRIRVNENPSYGSRIVHAETRTVGLTESHDEAKSSFS